MLRRQLTIPAVTITSLLGLALTGAGFWAGQRIAANTSERMVRYFAQDMVNDVSTVGDRLNRVLTRTSNDIARRPAALGDVRAMSAQLYDILSDEPDIDWVFFGSDAGGMVSAGRLADGTIVLLETDDLRAGTVREFDVSPDGQPAHLRRSWPDSDVRQKGWYRGAKERQGRYWSEPTIGNMEPLIGIPVSAPLFGRDGSFAGVIGTAIALTSLSREFRERILGNTGREFIMDAAGQLVVASAGVIPVATGAAGTQERLSAVNSNDPVVRATARYLRAHPSGVTGLSNLAVKSFAFDDPVLGTSYVGLTQFQEPGGGPWTIVAAVPTADFLGPAHRALFFSIGLSLLAVAVALALQAWLVGRALRPLGALTQAARSIASGEWSAVPEIRRNDEVAVLARAFKRMTVSLKETQENLRRREADYRNIFENAIEGIARSRLDGRLLSANPALVRMLGYTSLEDLSAALSASTDLVWVDPSVRRSAIDKLTSEGAVSGFEAEFYCKDGRRIWVWLNSRLVHDSAGGLDSVESFVSNITDRKNIEEALLQARAELAHIARVTTLGELIAAIAHEVSQPIAAVGLNASAASRWLNGSPPDLVEVQKCIGRITRDNQRAGDVINRIRVLVRRSPASRERLHINDIISEVVSLTQTEARQNHIYLSVQLSDGVPAISGDRVQLQQVILNLIMNAIEAISEIADAPRELVISSGPSESGDVLVTVRDWGKGLRPEQFDHVFDAFYTTKSAGLGMGLRISRTIIEAHGGRLWATVNSPRGAVFQFILPTAHAEDEPGVYQTMMK
jgi:PAS domain S-box-containing protein